MTLQLAHSWQQDKPLTASTISMPIIAEPCGESWDVMAGGSRVRRCTRCDHAVHNLAALSGSEIAHLLAQPGPLPCMRITTYADGTLLTTESQVSGRRMPLLAAAAISTAMALSAATGQSAGSAAASTHRRDRGLVVGHVTDPSGRPLSGASVMLLRHDNTVVETHSAADGSYALAGKPGVYQLVVDGPTLITQTIPVRLAKGARVDLPVRIAAVAERGVGTTMGVPANVPTHALVKMKLPPTPPKGMPGLKR